MISARLAIVGISCQFPSVTNLEDFWFSLTKSKQYINKWNNHYRFGLLNSDIDRNNPTEVCKNAIMQALLHAKLNSSKRFSLIIGNLIVPTQYDSLFNHYKNIIFKNNDKKFVSDSLKISSFTDSFNLENNSFVFDAACASLLYAFKFAQLLLSQKRINTVVAGAVSLSAVPPLLSTFAKLQALNNSAEYFPLSDNPSGLVPGEGLGFFVLKTLEQAKKDNDTIFGTIEDIAISNDGGNKHLLAPDGQGQQTNLRKIYDKPEHQNKRIDYIECHATGTAKGDRTELDTLNVIFSDKNHKPKIGANKGHFGHTLTASAAVSIIKVLLALKQGVLPKTLNNNKLLKIDENSWINDAILTTEYSWLKNATMPRYAGINAFGFGGCNSHMLLSDDINSKENVNIKKQQEFPLALIGLGVYLGTTENITELTKQLYFNKSLTTKWLTSVSANLLRYKIPANITEIPILSQIATLRAVDEALLDAGYDIDNKQRSIGVIVIAAEEYSINRYFFREWLESNYDEWINIQDAKLVHDKNKILQLFDENFITNFSSEKASSFIGNILASKISSVWKFNGPAFVIASQENALISALDLAKLLIADNELEAVVIAAVDMQGDTEKRLFTTQLINNNAGYTEGAAAIVVKPLTTTDLSAYAVFDEINFALMPNKINASMETNNISNNKTHFCENRNSFENNIFVGAVTPLLHLITLSLKIANKWHFINNASKPIFWLRNKNEKRQGCILREPFLEKQGSLVLSEPIHTKLNTFQLARNQYFIIPLSQDSKIELLDNLKLLKNELVNNELQQISNIYIKNFNTKSSKQFCIVFLVSSIEQFQQELNLAEDGINYAFTTGKDWSLPSGTCFSAKPLGKHKKLAFVYPMSGLLDANLLRNITREFSGSTDFIDDLTEDTLKKVNVEQLLMSSNDDYDPFTLIGGTVNYGKLITKILIDKFHVIPHSVCGCSLGELTMLYSLMQSDDSTLDEKLFEVLDQLIPVIFKPLGKNYTTFSIKGDLEKLKNIQRPKQPFEVQIIGSKTEAIISGNKKLTEEWLKSHSFQYKQNISIGYVHTSDAKIPQSSVKYLNEIFVDAKPVLNTDFYTVTRPKHKIELDSVTISNLIQNIITQPVNFNNLIHELYNQDVGFFIDIGPGVTSKRWIREILGDSEYVVESIHDTSEHSTKGILKLISKLITHQYNVNLDEFVTTNTTENNFIFTNIPQLESFLKDYLMDSNKSKNQDPDSFSLLINYHNTLSSLLKHQPEHGNTCIWDYQQILEITTGSIEKVLGIKYSSVEKSLKRARMPTPPFLFVTRVTSILAQYQQLTYAAISWEFDLPSQGIYVVNDTIWPLLFFESSHCSILLISYLGIEQIFKTQVSYRILKTESEFLGEFPKPSEILLGKIEITEFVKLDQQIIIKFKFTILNKGKPIVISNNIGGIFSEEMIEQHRNLQEQNAPQPKTASYENNFVNNINTLNQDQILLINEGKIRTALGNKFNDFKNFELCSKELLMIHNIKYWSLQKNESSVGKILSEWNITPEFWIFKCHFINDPVLPGTLMIEGILQTIKMFMIINGFLNNYMAPDFYFAQNKPTKTDFLAQVLPTNKKITYEITIRNFYTENNQIFVTADGLVFCDNILALKQTDLTLNIRDRYQQINPIKEINLYG